MIVRQFKLEDWALIELQPSQAYLREHLTHEYFEGLQQNYSITIVANDKIIAITGIKETEQGGMLWSFLSESAGDYMLRLHRIAMRMIETYQEQLIATTELDFESGDRWLKMLGFDAAGIEPHYGPDGRYHRVWVH